MKYIKGIVNALTVATLSSMLLSGLSIDAYSKEIKKLPSAGFDFFMSENSTSIKAIKEEKDSKKNKDVPTIVSNGLPNGATPSASATPTSDPLKSGINEELVIVEPIPESTPEATEGQEDENNEETSVIDNPSQEDEEIEIEETFIPTISKSTKEIEREQLARLEEEGFKNLVIAQVERNSWVNVRKEASEDAEKIGKLYDKSAGEFILEENGWYKIKSGSVTGFVKAEYCVTGEEAVELAKKVGTRIATVDTTTLKVREQPSTEAVTLGLVPMGEVLTVSEELDGWVKVNIEEGDGYVSMDYVKLSTEFVKAESKEEEEARLAKEERERQAAIEAANKAKKKNSNNSSTNSKGKKQVVYATGEGSPLGKELANYALQFVGNPYVYGGTSLTNGADCSGFTLSVYKHYGVSLPHSANAQRNLGRAVENLGTAQPGDLVCYSGHVGIYIGNGQIVHASSRKTGIKISKADYRTILGIRRIF